MKDLPTPDDEVRKELQDPNMVYTKKNILDGLPAYLKNPKNYIKVQKALIEVLACPKTHSDPEEVQTCKTCKDNILRRRQMMAKFGFTSLEQYMAWRKTHEEIKKLVPLEKYDRMLNE